MKSLNIIACYIKSGCAIETDLDLLFLFLIEFLSELKKNIWSLNHIDSLL